MYGIVSLNVAHMLLYFALKWPNVILDYYSLSTGQQQFLEKSVQVQK